MYVVESFFLRKKNSSKKSVKARYCHDNPVHDMCTVCKHFDLNCIITFICHLLLNSAHCSSYAFRCLFCSSLCLHRVRSPAEVLSVCRIRPERAILTYFWVNISGKACACTDVEMGRFHPIWFPHIFLGLTRLSRSRGQKQITSVFHTAPTRSVLLICAPPHMLERAGQGEDCYIWWFVFASWSR